MYVRWFSSAVDPADVDEIRRIFDEDVRPAFGKLEGCRGIELMMNLDRNAGGLVEGGAISHWDSLADLERALGSREVTESMVRVLALLRLEPVTKTYEVVA
jgi:quinol monooxygenase YgiN